MNTGNLSKMTNKVKVVAHGDRAILITRSFAAPRALVFDAMSKPEMMKQWFHGPPGWTLSTCEIDLRGGGNYRWVWTNSAGNDMGMGGVYKEVARPTRIVSTEKFDESWYPGEALVTIELAEEIGTTRMNMTVTYKSEAARDAVLAGPMASGVESSYSQLDAYLATL
ncbi:MAG: SRPBCC family protein [Flavobacteriales bacterium]